MLRPIAWGLASAIATALAAGPALADDAFYQGKTITIVTSTGAAGTYSIIARAVGRHMPRYLPGQPNFIVQHMPGAGHVLASNYMYNVAPKDGTAIATLNDAIPLHQALDGAGVRFDARKFNWLGASGSRNSSIYAWHTAGVKNFKDVQEREVIFGSTGAGSGTLLYSTVANNVLGAKFKIVSGYKVSDDIDFALERGEVQANSGSLGSLFSARTAWLAEKKIVFLAQIGATRDAELPDVPLLTELATTEQQRQVLQLISSPTTVGRPYTAPPDVPADRIAALRRAFSATMADAEFRAEMVKQNIDISPKTGDQVAKIVADTIDAPPAVIAQAKAAMPKRE